MDGRADGQTDKRDMKREAGGGTRQILANMRGCHVTRCSDVRPYIGAVADGEGL